MARREARKATEQGSKSIVQRENKQLQKQKEGLETKHQERGRQQPRSCEEKSRQEGNDVIMGQEEGLAKSAPLGDRGGQVGLQAWTHHDSEGDNSEQR
jgi:hypothetical protein